MECWWNHHVVSNFSQHVNRVVQVFRFLTQLWRRVDSRLRQLDGVGFTRARMGTGGVQSQSCSGNRGGCIDLDSSTWRVVRSTRWNNPHVRMTSGSELSRAESTRSWSECAPMLSLLDTRMAVYCWPDNACATTFRDSGTGLFWSKRNCRTLTTQKRYWTRSTGGGSRGAHHEGTGHEGGWHGVIRGDLGLDRR